MPAADASNPIEAVRARLDGGRKWLQGRGRDGLGNVCLSRACVEVIPEWGARLPVREAIEGVIREQYPEFKWVASPIVALNDDLDTSWPRIDAMLDKASVRWDEQVR